MGITARDGRERQRQRKEGRKERHRAPSSLAAAVKRIVGPGRSSLSYDATLSNLAAESATTLSSALSRARAQQTRVARVLRSSRPSPSLRRVRSPYGSPHGSSYGYESENDKASRDARRRRTARRRGRRPSIVDASSAASADIEPAATLRSRMSVRRRATAGSSPASGSDFRDSGLESVAAWVSPIARQRNSPPIARRRESSPIARRYESSPGVPRPRQGERAGRTQSPTAMALQSENEKLKQENKMLRESVEAAEAELETAMATMVELRNQATALKSQVHSHGGASATEATLRRELAAARRELAESRKRSPVRGVAADAAMEAELAAEVKRRFAAEERAEELKGGLDAMKDRLSTLTISMRELEAASQANVCGICRGRGGLSRASTLSMTDLRQETGGGRGSHGMSREQEMAREAERREHIVPLDVVMIQGIVPAKHDSGTVFRVALSINNQNLPTIKGTKLGGLDGVTAGTR